MCICMDMPGVGFLLYPALTTPVVGKHTTSNKLTPCSSCLLLKKLLKHDKAK